MSDFDKTIVSICPECKEQIRIKTNSRCLFISKCGCGKVRCCAETLHSVEEKIHRFLQLIE